MNNEDKSAWEWQLVGPDAWNFGKPIRGIIRDVRALVYYDENTQNPSGGWRWKIAGGVGGYTLSYLDAIRLVEEGLDIIPVKES